MTVYGLNVNSRNTSNCRPFTAKFHNNDDYVSYKALSTASGTTTTMSTSSSSQIVIHPKCNRETRYCYWRNTNYYTNNMAGGNSCSPTSTAQISTATTTAPMLYYETVDSRQPSITTSPTTTNYTNNNMNSNSASNNNPYNAAMPSSSQCTTCENVCYFLLQLIFMMATLIGISLCIAGVVLRRSAARNLQVLVYIGLLLATVSTGLLIVQWRARRTARHKRLENMLRMKTANIPLEPLAQTVVVTVPCEDTLTLYDQPYSGRLPYRWRHTATATHMANI